MRRILAFATVLALIAGPALAQEYRFSANAARGYSGRTDDLPNIQMKRRVSSSASFRKRCMPPPSGGFHPSVRRVSTSLT